MNAPNHRGQPRELQNGQSQDDSLEPPHLAQQLPQLVATSTNAVGDGACEFDHRSSGESLSSAQASTGSLWIAVLIAALVCTFSNFVVAAPRPLVEREVALRGRSVRHRIWLDTGPSSTPASVNFSLRGAAGLDPTRTTFMVELDGTPRRSGSLASVGGEQDWEVSLGVLPEGRHALELIGHLVLLDESCTPHDLNTWVVLETASSIDHEPSATAPLLGLAALPARWISEATPVVRIIARKQGGPWAHARISADHVTRDWGLEPRHGLKIPTDEAPLTIELDVLPDPDARRGSPLALALVAAPSAIGIVDPAPDRLRVLARKESMLPAVVDRLSSPRFRALCGRGPCLVGPPGPPLPATRSDFDDPDIVAFTLEDAEHPDGWSARGEGDHVLTLNWKHPPDWTIEGSPRLVLPIRWSGVAPGFAPVLLHVRLGDHPMATWVLDEVPALETVPLTVRIPKIWWERDNWDLRAIVELRPLEPDPCRVIDPGMPWVSIDPGARLEVPRSQPLLVGIAAFYETRLRSEEALVVDWTPNESGDDIASVAAMLYPFSKGGPKGPGIRYAAEFADIVVRGMTADGDDIQLEGDGETPILVDRSGALEMPAHALASVAYLALESDQLRFIPSQHTEDIAVPPYGGLTGWRALLLPKGWMSFDPAPATDLRKITAGSPTSSPGPATAVPESLQEQRQGWFNIIWLIVSGLVILGLAYILRRRSRPMDLGEDLQA